VVTEPGLFSVAAADRALRAIEEIRRGLSPACSRSASSNRVRPQSIEHQFRIKELRDMFGPLVLSPQLPERTSLQQAQGAAKPHLAGRLGSRARRRLRRAAGPRHAHRPDHRRRAARLSLTRTPAAPPRAHAAPSRRRVRRT
jgi:cellulose biosynthesis protein BcsQ